MTWKELKDFLNTLDQDVLDQTVMAYDVDYGRFMHQCDLMDSVEDDIISHDSLFLTCSSES